jgi:hypothetical protein
MTNVLPSRKKRSSFPGSWTLVRTVYTKQAHTGRSTCRWSSAIPPFPLSSRRSLIGVLLCPIPITEKIPSLFSWSLIYYKLSCSFAGKSGKKKNRAAAAGLCFSQQHQRHDSPSARGAGFEGIVVAEGYPVRHGHGVRATQLPDVNVNRHGSLS